jgi:hypothetical protein
MQSANRSLQPTAADHSFSPAWGESLLPGFVGAWLPSGCG